MHICNQFLFEDKKTVTFVGCILSVKSMFNVVVPIWRNIIGVLYQIVVSGWQCPCPDCIFAMQPPKEVTSRHPLPGSMSPPSVSVIRLLLTAGCVKVFL